MKQVAKQISIYAADVSGVASAMFELGGMTVIHDPSGCNSTYNTHDETRWYDHDSLIFISALTQKDAAMGNDDKLISDICRTALKLRPAFISICGTPVPYMTGTDFRGIAAAVEKRTGIPTFGMHTNNMHAYFVGAGEAFGNIARRLVPERNATGQSDSGAGAEAGAKGLHNAKVPKQSASNAVFKKRINILGVTPLDFSAQNAGKKFKAVYEAAGYEVISVWAMDSTLDELMDSAAADVNIVVSSAGLEPAKVLRDRFGTPYAIGLPCIEPYGGCEMSKVFGQPDVDVGKHSEKLPHIVFLGEAVQNVSLAILTENVALASGKGISTCVISPLDTPRKLLRPGDVAAEDETDIIPYLRGADILVADPLYKPVCPDGTAFYPLPHHGFSGRMYDYGSFDAPDIICEATEIVDNILDGAVFA